MTTGANPFSSGLQDKINGYLTRYETKRSAILPVLHAIQDELGWISDENVAALQQHYQLHQVEVKEVLTFYTAYRKSPPKKFMIQFCDNIMCTLMGANQVIDRIRTHIDNYEAKTGKDAPFAVEGVPCLCVCDGAPAMLVNKDRHLKVTIDTVDSVLEKYAPLPK